MYDDDTEEACEEHPQRRKPLRPEIVYCDDELLVVNKPAGVTLDSEDDTEQGLFELLPPALGPPDAASVAPAFPLDSDISGALILPRTDRATRHFGALFAENRLALRCVAIVSGFVDAESGTIDLPISHHPRDGMPFRDPHGGALTRTVWRLRDRFVGHAVLECEPSPAVPHYVRMHLQSVDLPLAVDQRYGGSHELLLSSFKAGYRPSRRHEERPLIERVSMHVAEVGFTHPATGEPMRVAAAMPKDMRATLHQLERFGRQAR